MKTIILDPGHGMSNRRPGHFDPGALSNGLREADVVMDWANDIRTYLLAIGHRVVRTRVDNSDPAPISARAGIAREYGGAIMLSIHCNAHTGAANGTETYYRGASNADLARAINDAVVSAMGTRNRGIKQEKDSQHKTIAVMSFQPCFLLEIGFLDNASDRQKMLDLTIRKKACAKIAKILSNAVG